MTDVIIQDNFLPDDVFLRLQNYCSENEFQEIVAGDKAFSVLEVPDYISPYLEREGYSIILSFIRRAWKEFDFSPRIHADGIIQGKKADLASVLYVNAKDGVSPNGTSFFQHIELGDRLPKDASEELFNHLILNESNDLSKWELRETVNAEPNRLLVYDSRLFHAKTPAVIDRGTRVVLVSFYQANTNQT